MKRSGDTISAEDAKHRKLEKSNDDFDASKTIEPFLNDLEQIQVGLQEIDEECARKQLLIQKEYDEKKKPIFNKRQQIINKIPQFWSRCIRNHPSMAFLVEADFPLLDLLNAIDIEDNIDEHGSYHITFTFDKEVEKHFTPNVLEKLIRFQGEGDETVEKCTEIKWSNPKENPIQSAINERITHREEEGMDGDEEEDAGFPYSFFEWFTKEMWPPSRQDIGELIRRELWHSPLSYFLADDDDDDDDDEVEVDDGEDTDDVTEGQDDE